MSDPSNCDQFSFHVIPLTIIVTTMQIRPNRDNIFGCERSFPTYVYHNANHYRSWSGSICLDDFSRSVIFLILNDTTTWIIDQNSAPPLTLRPSLMTGKITSSEFNLRTIRFEPSALILFLKKDEDLDEASVEQGCQFKSSILFVTQVPKQYEAQKRIEVIPNPSAPLILNSTVPQILKLFTSPSDQARSDGPGGSPGKLCEPP